jgi:hypothetical protein
VSESLVIPERYCGFADIAHGGYVSGLLAAELGGGPAEVTLRGRVPMGAALDLGHPGPDRVTLGSGGSTVAEAAAIDLDLEVPNPVSFAEAEEASRSYPGHAHHLFPACFGCGPDRAADDGLRLFAGRVDGRDLIAAPWVPDRSIASRGGDVRPEYVWAAVDCPQLWALILTSPPDSPERVVTSRLAASVNGVPRVGSANMVVAWPIGRDGRERTIGAAVISEDGEALALARQTSVVVDWGVPLGLDSWRRR